MSDSIGIQPWMTQSHTRAVLGALQAKGGPDCVRFVGGCVRNAVMGIVAADTDIDLATTLTPDEVASALEAAGLRGAPTGVEHGTITAIAEGKPIEVTTLRRDVSTDGRRAVVAFTKDWSEDAQRRDFRLNALYADSEGTVFDPTGEGLADAREGRIVFVGDPLVRIREDYLRILRFYRFQAWYGRGPPDAAALAACRALKGMLSGRAAERTSKELLKLLGADDPRQAVRLMADTGVLAAVLPGAAGLARFDRLVQIERAILIENDPELRLAALLPSDPKAVAATAERLRLSNAQRDRLAAAAGAQPRIASWMSAREVRRAVHQQGVRAFYDRVKLAWAASDREATAPQWRALLAQAESWSSPEFPVTGEDALAAGVPKGPRVGQVLREVEDWWIDHDFPEDRAAALEKLRLVAQAIG
jgi:poly(A) polymerase